MGGCRNGGAGLLGRPGEDLETRLVEALWGFGRSDGKGKKPGIWKSITGSCDLTYLGSIPIILITVQYEIRNILVSIIFRYGGTSGSRNAYSEKEGRLYSLLKNPFLHTHIYLFFGWWC